MNLQKLRKYLGVLCILILCLISLGGAVRAVGAGLSCPDWPLCFGQIIPGFDVKVYFEFIHRVLAGLVAIVTFYLGFQILKKEEISGGIKKLVIFTWVLLLAQILMGGLTVILKLHFSTVATHLALGTAFFCTILWIYMFFAESREDLPLKGHKRMVGLVLGAFLALIVYAQIIMGGLVSSNYAGLACTDFPLCNGQWVPTFEGLVGLQVMHRVGAYTVFICAYLAYFIFSALRKKLPPKVLKASRMITSMVLMQILLGMSNVIFKLPPLITVLHLALATMILGTTVRIIFLSTYET